MKDRCFDYYGLIEASRCPMRSDVTLLPCCCIIMMMHRNFGLWCGSWQGGWAAGHITVLYDMGRPMIYVKATNTGCTAAAVVTHLSTFSTSILCRVNLTGQQQFKQKASVKKLLAHYPSLGNAVGLANCWCC